MIEEWRDINEYEGLYQVSNLGRVKNVRRNKVLKTRLTTNGYKDVSLSKNNAKKTQIGPPLSSANIYTKPRKQTNSQPY